MSDVFKVFAQSLCKGGTGSGNFGHSGREGEVGGSAKEQAIQASAQAEEATKLSLTDTKSIHFHQLAAKAHERVAGLYLNLDKEHHIPGESSEYEKKAYYHLDQTFKHEGAVKELKSASAKATREATRSQKADYSKLDEADLGEAFTGEGKVSASTIDALKNYSGHCSSINNFLRGSGVATDKITTEIDLINQGFLKSKTSRGVTVYRAEDYNHDSPEFIKLKKLEVGSVFSKKGFISTSPEPGWSSGADERDQLVRYTIKLPKGTPALPLNLHTASFFTVEGESEILLQHEQKFKVLSNKSSGNTHSLLLQAVF